MAARGFNRSTSGLFQSGSSILNNAPVAGMFTGKHRRSIVPPVSSGPWLGLDSMLAFDAAGIVVKGPWIGLDSIITFDQ